jgi:transcription antitermination factor NusG
VPILKREADLYPSNLFDLSPAEHPWWVAWVRSRQEKGLARHLVGCGVGFYLPQSEKLSRREGRTSVSHLPLFPGYLFFRGPREARRSALTSNLIVQVLPVLDQDRLHAELAGLWRLQREGLVLVPHPYLGVGDEVEVVDGPLRGWTGTVLREKGRLKLVVSVSFLRRSVAAELDRDVLIPARAHLRRPLAVAS